MPGGLLVNSAGVLTSPPSGNVGRVGPRAALWQHFHKSPERVVANLHGAVCKACASAGVALPQNGRTCLGQSRDMIRHLSSCGLVAPEVRQHYKAEVGRMNVKFSTQKRVRDDDDISTGAPHGLGAGSLLMDPAVMALRPTKGTFKRSTRDIARQVQIHCLVDSGNIRVIRAERPEDIQLSIAEEPFCQSDGRKHYQWFHFSVTGAQHMPLNMSIINAGGSTFPEAWDGTRACASYDLEYWFRVTTTYDSLSGTLSILHIPECNSVRYAYFVPYPQERHARLIGRMQLQKNVTLNILGRTLEGRCIDMLQVGAFSPGKAKIWILARQHPGETMSEWFVEGLLERLTDKNDAITRKLLREALFFIVPNMCPDGSARGHLRTNAVGANLNREWQSPSLTKSPEVYHTLNRMVQEGVDLLIDVHGDEGIPAVFISGNEGIPSWNEDLASLERTFIDSFLQATPDFQNELGYAKDAPGQANLALCAAAVGERFKCLALTLEMPFKDADYNPDIETGWNPTRSKKLGADILVPIMNTLPLLR